MRTIGGLQKTRRSVHYIHQITVSGLDVLRTVVRVTSTPFYSVTVSFALIYSG